MAQRFPRPADTRARIALLPHNPYFAEDVRRAREQLGLPPGGLPPNQASDWASGHQYDEAVLEALRGLLRDYGIPEAYDLALLQYVADNSPAHLPAMGQGTGRLRAVHREFGNGTAELRVAFSIAENSKAEVMGALEERYNWIEAHHPPPRVRQLALLDEYLGWWRRRHEEGKTGTQIAAELRAITPQAVRKGIRTVEALMRPLSQQPQVRPRPRPHLPKR